MARGVSWDVGACVPAAVMADSAEQAPRGLDVGFEYGFDVGAKAQVRVTDDTGDCRSISLCRSGGEFGHERRFADGAHRLGALFVILGSRLDKDGLLDSMAGVCVFP